MINQSYAGVQANAYNLTINNVNLTQTFTYNVSTGIFAGFVARVF
jgi:hypothetical protein